MSTPRQCRSCNSLMKDVRLCLSCHTAHELDLPSNRGHSKIECTNPWHTEGVAAPLEPSAWDVNKFADEWEAQSPHDIWDAPLSFAEAYAAAVSKNRIDKYAEMEAKWIRELLTVSEEIGTARNRIAELEKEIAALGRDAGEKL